MTSSDSSPLEPPGRSQGRVRWRRFALMFVPALGVAGALVGLTAAGALTNAISVSGQSFTVAASSLQGSNFAQYGAPLPTAAGTKMVAVSVIGDAHLSNLCQAVSIPSTPLSLKLTAGGGGTAAHATNMVVAADRLQGDATFHNIVIGQNAGDLGANGVTPAPTAGTFGEMADSVTINNLRQNTWLTTAGTFSLPGLNLGFTTDPTPCG
jgi:hypothetical protein